MRRESLQRCEPEIAVVHWTRSSRPPRSREGIARMTCLGGRPARTSRKCSTGQPSLRVSAASLDRAAAAHTRRPSVDLHRSHAGSAAGTRPRAHTDARASRKLAQIVSHPVASFPSSPERSHRCCTCPAASAAASAAPERTPPFSIAAASPAPVSTKMRKSMKDLPNNGSRRGSGAGAGSALLAAAADPRALLGARWVRDDLLRLAALLRAITEAEIAEPGEKAQRPTGRVQKKDLARLTRRPGGGGERVSLECF